MTTEEFEKIVSRHSLCPGEALYGCVAFAGEVGEVCNSLKKMIMAHKKPEWVSQSLNPLLNEDHWHQQLKDELGDALFYLARIALDNGTNLQTLMHAQEDKLIEQSNKYKRIFLK